MIEYLSSDCILASPGSPCTDPEADDCRYEYIFGDYCCCGNCHGPQWLTLACNFDSTTGTGFWQAKNLTLCPPEGCGIEGKKIISTVPSIYPTFLRCCLFAQLPWQLSEQSSTNTYHTSRKRDGHFIAVHCVWPSTFFLWLLSWFCDSHRRGRDNLNGENLRFHQLC